MFEHENGFLFLGNNIDILKELEDNSIDAIVTDPPYGLGKEPDAVKLLKDWLEVGYHEVKGKGFMGKEWDAFVPQPAFWKEVYRVLKPGGHVLSFFGTRTYDWGTLAIRLAGFEIRDCIQWLYGSGFPKSQDISKMIDKKGGEGISWFGEWLRNWRLENNITQKEIAKLFPSKTGGLTGCVANWELGLNIPTPEQFSIICKKFNLPFQSISEAKREVIGKIDSNKLAVAPGQNNDRGAIELNITSPSTDAAKEWQGWGTALKPANEPICVARKPLSEKTVAENILKWGTGGINIDACRIGFANEADEKESKTKNQHQNFGSGTRDNKVYGEDNAERTNYDASGRFPANVILDMEAGRILDIQTGVLKSGGGNKKSKSGIWGNAIEGVDDIREVNSGGASRFFYCAKTSQKERGEGNNHPTVKPIALMEYLIKLITPPGGIVLEPFAGSCTTLLAAINLKVNFIGMEKEEEYYNIGVNRIENHKI
jgi:DNA modification methylase